MSETAHATKTATLTRTETKRPSMWHVVVLDDDDHTYEYVMEMLMGLFGHSPEKAFAIAEAIDLEGRGICATLHLELAEFRKEQIVSFGADPRLDASAGPMGVVLEPADAGDDENDD
jgi:ATP-dependent Clp protease adaptor protein ClpS